jgi:hypothetical protein
MYKQFRWLFCLLLVKTQLYGQGYTSAVVLKAQIDSLAAIEEQAQLAYNQGLTKGVNPVILENLSLRRDTEVRSHRPIIKRIIGQYGFPGYNLAGREGAHNFWVLVRNCSDEPTFQEQVLFLMKIEVDQKNASPTEYAFLVDQVNVSQGKSQVYGTQVRFINGRAVPKAMIEPEKVNQRRGPMNLGSIDVYLLEMTRINLNKDL